MAEDPSRRDPFRLAGVVIDGKYRVVELIGEGGFGVVYSGRHEAFDEPIAIKCLKIPAGLEDASRASLLRRLRDEGRILHRLSTRTPAIVQALDAGAVTTEAGLWVPYLVLEWLEGETLADHLRARRTSGRSPMPLAEAIDLLEPAARALATAHAERVAHRDIKPENLFVLRGRGAPGLKVLDFGIAKVVADETAAMSETGPGPTSFTPGYGAPEQFDKRLGATGPWTDVFALALVLVEVVSGRRALAGEDFADLFRAALDAGRRPTLREHGVQVPQAVERALVKALAVEPRARFADAGAFWDALAEAAEGAHTAPPESAPPDVASLPTMQFVEREAIDTALDAKPAAKPRADEAFSPTIPADDLPDASKPAHDTKKPVQDTPGSASPADTTKPSHEPTQRSPSAAARSAGPEATPRVHVDPPSTPNRSLTPWLATGAVAVGAAALFFFSRRPPPDPQSGSAAASEAPVLASTSVSAPPISKNPEASAAYREALQAYRDGGFDVAQRLLEKALSADPDLSAAALRLAIWRFYDKPVDARAIYQKALRGRASLDARDTALLEAAEAYVRQPSDLAEWEKRLVAATEKYPNDAELWVYVCDARARRAAFTEAITACDRALAAEPRHVVGWSWKAFALGFQGDSAGELAAYSECLSKSPSATLCLKERIRIHGRQGQCAAMAADARRWISIEARSSGANSALAAALFATNAPRESVLTAMKQSWTGEPPRGPEHEASDRTTLAVLDGDFEQTEKLVRDWQHKIAEKTDQQAHADAALDLTRAFDEMGKIKEAGEAARDFLTRMGAWAEPANAADWAITFLPFAYRAGLVSAADLDRDRVAWMDRVRSKWRESSGGREEALTWILWIDGYATGVTTEAEARAALAHLPSAPPPADTVRWLAFDAELGKTLALGGRSAEAIPYLRRMTRSCGATTDSWNYVRSSYHLGLALEATGDKPGATLAYRAVLARWGKARPRSVTADRARERLHALGEKP